MDLITKTPGLQHIAENTFRLLNGEDLQSCRLVNQNIKEIIDTPKFWIQKLSQLPELPRRIEECPLCRNSYDRYDYRDVTPRHVGKKAHWLEYHGRIDVCDEYTH